MEKCNLMFFVFLSSERVGMYCDTGDPGLLARHGLVVLGIGLQPLQLVQGVPPVQHPAKHRVLQICNMYSYSYKMRAFRYLNKQKQL